MSLTLYHKGKMIELQENDCMMTPVERGEAEPTLKRERESNESTMLLSPLLPERKSLNLWFFSRSRAHEKDADDVLSAIMNDSATIETVDVGADLWNHLSAEAVAHVLHSIANIPNLKWLCFSLSSNLQASYKEHKSLSIEFLSHILSKAKHLEFLILRDVHLTGSNSDRNELADVLKSNTSLQHVSFDAVVFDDSVIDLDGFVLGLAQIPSLRLVEILHNKCPDSKVTEVSPYALKTLLNDGHALQVLRLCGLGIGDEHIMEMSASIKVNKTLKELWLWRTQVTEKGFVHLTDALFVNESIAMLNLHDNDLASQAGEDLFKCLHQKGQSGSSSLEELYLGCQDMRESCRHSFLKMIEGNKAIKKLEVCFNWPNKALVQEMAQFHEDLARAFHSQPTLEYIRLFSNPSVDQKDLPAPHLKWELFIRNQQSDDDE